MARGLCTAAVVLVLFVAAAQASRLAFEQGFEDGDFFGRGLLQRTLVCSTIHPACATCRTQRIPGSRNTENVCSTCQTGWRLRRDGKSKTCDCAPGLHKVTTNGVDSCETCPEGQYCVGGSGSNEASSATDCPAGLATTFAGARSLQQCFTEAGFGRSSTRNSAGFVTLTGTQCAIGTYNVGGNTAGCQKCPAGLTTESPGSTSLADCKAPAGSYVDRGIGKLCPKGSYTIELNSATSCTACPDGITTSAEGSDSADDCAFAKRGFWMENATTAKPCPVNTYNDGETLQVGVECPACPNGWKTKDVGADGQSLCLAPPGFELRNGATDITECQNGYYKADWNRNACVPCGTGLITAGTGSVSKDACLVPAGSGITALNPLAASICIMNTYGVSVNRSASAAARCTACAPHMFTADHIAGAGAATVGYTAETDCMVSQGWGITAAGVAEECPKGTWNQGSNRGPCKPCAPGFTTLATGSHAETDCVIQPGWFWDAARSLAAPCDIGEWSAGGDANARLPEECNECGTGVTTETDESTSADDCKICLAGYGGANCDICTYNTFSFGGQVKGTACSNCASGSVSRKGSTESDMCVSELQDAVRDVFSTSGSWVGGDATADASSTACAAACVADAACMTYRYKDTVDGKECDLFKEDAAGTQTLYFKLNDGADFVSYKIGAGVTFGVQVATPSAANAAACMAACKTAGDCEVASWNGSACSLRSSELDSDYTGMWVVRGARMLSDPQA